MSGPCFNLSKGAAEKCAHCERVVPRHCGGRGIGEVDVQHILVPSKGGVEDLHEVVMLSDAQQRTRWTSRVKQAPHVRARTN